MPMQDDMKNYFASKRQPVAASTGELDKTVDELWAQYEAQKPKKKKPASKEPKQESPVKSQPIASGGIPAPMAAQGMGGGMTARQVRPELSPGVPMPTGLGDAESMMAQLRGGIDPRARATDPRVQAMESGLADFIRSRRAAGEKLSWEK